MYSEVYEEIIALLQNEKEGETELIYKYLEELYHHTFLGNKLIFGDIVVNTFRHLSKPNVDPETLRLAYVMTCCLEIMLTGCIVHDDMLDNGKTRQNKRCWHLLAEEKGYGSVGISDGLHLIVAAQKILKHYFQRRSFYVNLLELVNEALYKGYFIQTWDVLTSSVGSTWENLSIDTYKRVFSLVTGYGVYNISIAFALHLSGETNPKVFQCAESIAAQIGQYYQMQDDFLDVYGNMELTEKHCNDIEEGKPSWLILNAFQLANSTQKSLLKENYGKRDKAKAQIVKDVYDQLDLPAVYAKHKEDEYTRITRLAQDIEKEDGIKLPKEIFTDLLDILYNRH